MRAAKTSRAFTRSLDDEPVGLEFTWWRLIRDEPRNRSGAVVDRGV